MDAVRAFGVDDVPQVTRLWLRIFRGRECEAPPRLQDYFRQIFFESPWVDASLPSLVYEERDRGVVGFLGVMPRRMTFNGEAVRVAVPTQVMAEERAPYAAARLMRTFLAGPQDLSFSDGSNDMGERLCRASGGKVATLYSLQWTRILRPAQFARIRLEERGGPGYALFAKALRPLCRAADALAARTAPGARWLPDTADARIEDEPSCDTLLWCVRQFSGNRALIPEYDGASWRWLLERAAEKAMFGKLRKAIVWERNGELAGWYLYYVERDRVGQVLQFGARPQAVSKVLNCLFHQALEHGAVAVAGGVDPPFTKEIARSRCEFSWPGYSTLMHSRDPELLNAIYRGDALLSRLEAEWWARFSDPEWSVTAPSAAAPGRGQAEATNILRMGTP